MSKKIDITGQKFGKLTAIKSCGKNKHGHSLWECLCSCGNSKVVTIQGLKDGTSSCGCIKLPDLTGQKFGKLTVLNKSLKKDVLGNTFWDCKCECGNSISVKNSVIKRQKSCGCVSQKHNLIGKRFGKLIVIKEDGRSKNGHQVMWECLCDCGNTIRAATGALNAGHRTTCKCSFQINYGCGAANKLDLLGQKFDKLTVIEEVEERNVRGLVRWKCLCDCGKITIVNGSALKGEAVRSCGCLHRENQYESIKLAAFRGHLYGAKDRGIVCYLTFEEYVAIALQPCVYCTNFSKRKNVSTKAELEFNSVDRRDNEPYYKLENCQSVCFTCQFMKQDLPHKEFLEHVRAIHKNISK
jgi:hypothetical protein